MAALRRAVQWLLILLCVHSASAQETLLDNPASEDSVLALAHDVVVLVPAQDEDPTESQTGPNSPHNDPLQPHAPSDHMQEPADVSPAAAPNEQQAFLMIPLELGPVVLGPDEGTPTTKEDLLNSTPDPNGPGPPVMSDRPEESTGRLEELAEEQGPHDPAEEPSGLGNPPRGPLDQMDGVDDMDGPPQGRGPPGQREGGGSLDGPPQGQGPPGQREGGSGMDGPPQGQGPPGQREGGSGMDGPPQGQGPPGQREGGSGMDGPPQGQGPPGQREGGSGMDGPPQGQGPPGQREGGSGMDGPPQGQGPPGQREGGPHQLTGRTEEQSPDGLGRGQEEESLNDTQCMSMEECQEEEIDKFIETWLTYEGLPGMVFLIGNSVSLVGLFATFLTFLAFRQLRASPRGLATMNFIVALFVAKLAFQVNPHFAGYECTCSILAMMQHYFCLGAFLWMNVMAYDIMMESLEAKQAVSADATNPPSRNAKRSMPLYALFAWGIPCTVVTTCCLLELYLGGRFRYGNQEQCGVFGDQGLLYTLAFPLTIISILNMVFFVVTIRWLPASVVVCRRPIPPSSQTIEKAPADQDVTDKSIAKAVEALGLEPTVSRVDTSPAEFTPEVAAEEIKVDLTAVAEKTTTSGKYPTVFSGNDGEQAEKTTMPSDGRVVTCGSGKPFEVCGSSPYLSHRQVWAYVRMSVLLSISWLSGFLSVFTQQYWMWILFVTVNSLQGILVFVSLVLTGPVLSLYMERFRLLPAVVRHRKRPATEMDKGLNVGPYPCNLPVISDGYVLLDETTDIVFIQ